MPCMQVIAMTPRGCSLRRPKTASRSSLATGMRHIGRNARSEAQGVRLKRWIDQVANRCKTVVAPALFRNMKLDANKAAKTVIVSVRQLKLPCTKRKMEWFATFLPQPCIFNLAGGSKENKRHIICSWFCKARHATSRQNWKEISRSPKKDNKLNR